MRGKDFSIVEMLPHKLNDPYKWKKGIVFVNAFSDFMHEKVTDEFRDRQLEVMRKNPQLTFITLTKRPVSLWRYMQRGDMHLTENMWWGVSVESGNYLWRWANLLQMAEGRDITNLLISFEPLLEGIPRSDLISYRVSDAQWIIVGGESDYSNPRPMHPSWAKEIRDLTRDFKIPFFFKQNGGSVKCECHGSWGCCLLDGQEHHEFPEDMRGGE
jgi:protein gp37